MGISRERKAPPPELAIGDVETPLGEFSDVRVWPKADKRNAVQNVRFWGKADIIQTCGNVRL